MGVYIRLLSPTNQQKMNNLRTLRITERISPQADQRFINQLLDDYFNKEEPYMIVRELGKDNKNPHYHLAGTLLEILPGSDSKSDDPRTEFLRRRVKALGWKGQKYQAWGLGKPDLMDSHFDYLCKGSGTGKQDGPHVIRRHPDFTDAVIAQRHEIYWKVNARLPKEGAKKRKRNASEEILTMCRERNIQSTEHGKIFDQVLRYYCKHVKYLQPIYVKNLVHQTSIYLNPEGNTAEVLRTYCLNNYCM